MICASTNIGFTDDRIKVKSSGWAHDFMVAKCNGIIKYHTGVHHLKYYELFCYHYTSSPFVILLFQVIAKLYTS